MREVGSLAGWVLGYVVASQIGVTVDQQGRRRPTAAFTVVHQRRPAVPDAVRHPRRLAADRDHAADVPRGGPRRHTTRWSADLSLGARLSAVALVPITAGLIVLGPVARPSSLFAYGETSIAGARLIGTALAWLGVRAVPVRAGDAAAARLLRDARRPHPDPDQRRSWSAPRCWSSCIVPRPPCRHDVDCTSSRPLTVAPPRRPTSSARSSGTCC